MQHGRLNSPTFSDRSKMERSIQLSSIAWPGIKSRGRVCESRGRVCDRHAPLRTKRTQSSKYPWITTVLKQRMNFRDRLKRKAIKIGDPSIWNQFRKTKNQLNREIKSAKKAYYKSAFISCSKDQRKTWKTVNELTSRESIKSVINEC